MTKRRGESKTCLLYGFWFGLKKLIIVQNWWKNKPEWACISRIIWSLNGRIVYSLTLLFATILLEISESEWHCIIDRKSINLIFCSADRPNFWYTSSARRLATVILRPTRTNIVSNSMRLRCEDVWKLCELVALVSPMIVLLSNRFHSWNRLFDRFSKSKLSGNTEWGQGKWAPAWNHFAYIQVWIKERQTVSTKVIC